MAFQSRPLGSSGPGAAAQGTPSHVATRPEAQAVAVCGNDSRCRAQLCSSCADMPARQAREAGHRGGAAPWWRRAGRSRACPRPRAPSSASTAATQGRRRSQSNGIGRRSRSCRPVTRPRQRGCRSRAGSPRLRGAASALSAPGRGAAPVYTIFARSLLKSITLVRAAAGARDALSARLPDARAQQLVQRSRALQAGGRRAGTRRAQSGARYE